jgi:beta-galactosidase
MKNKLLLLGILACTAACTLAAQARKELLLENGWKFSKGDFAGAMLPEYDDSRWESVAVPHDWAIAGPFDRQIDMQVVTIEQNGEQIPTEHTGRTGALPYIGVGWYRLRVDIPEGYAHAELCFDGAMAEPVVYVNGKEAGRWANGYSAFNVDITPFLSKGVNTLAVRLQNLGESSRWYSGAGVYRPVRLALTQATAVKTWGITVTTPTVTEDMAVVDVSAALRGGDMSGVTVHTEILDAAGNPVGVQAAAAPLSNGQSRCQMEVKSPRLWSPEAPELYTLRTTIRRNGVATDEVQTRFGIRAIAFSPEKGFQLNGKTRKLKGVCLHHDLGPLGAALNKAALRRQLAILKDMGCDAIRTAHNMPSVWQMELCDEMGFMVMAESFDMWRYPKCKNGYNRFFDDWVEKDLVNLVQCHKNHPSIVMWSIGNEIPEQGSAEGARLAKKLQDIVHREDPTRFVTQGIDRVDAALKSGFAAIMDVPGLNYRTHKYEEAYSVLPQGFLLGSETASTVSSRGVYKFPAEEKKDATYPDRQCSSYDLESCRWSNIPEDDWTLQDDKAWVTGEFVWTGFDYLGEPTPYDRMWPARSSYFGIVDLAGLPKDRYYLYRSRWNANENTLHILPHWSWEGREGEVTPVYVYTNYPAAELFVNGVSQGRRSKDASTRLDRYRLRWSDVRYQPGELRVAAYDEAGKIAAEKTVKTAGKPHHLHLAANRAEVAADGKDLAYVTVSVVDKDGNLCPSADNRLRLSVAGAGKFKAACNGDASSLEPFAQPAMKAFGGQLVVLLQSAEKPGVIRLQVSAKGLKTGNLQIVARE